MSRTKVFLFILMGMTFTYAGSASAVNFQIGLKYWFADWEINHFKVPLGEQKLQLDLTQQMTVAPYVASISNSDNKGTGLGGAFFSVAFSKWTVAVTGYFGEYDLRMKDISRRRGADLTNYLRETEIKLSSAAERIDGDITVMYRWKPNVSFFIGYKGIYYTYDKQQLLTDNTIYIEDPQGGWIFFKELKAELEIQSLEVLYHGPALGFAGSATLGKHFFSFGSASLMPYLFGAQDTKDLTKDDRGWAYNVEVGIGLAFSKAHFMPTLAYRWQQFGGFIDLRDTFHGVVLSTNFMW